MRLEATYEIKMEFLGRKAKTCKEEIRVLNRTISWTDQGIHYEPDQRHADLIVEQAGMSSSKSISTTCCTDVEYDESKRLQSGYLQSSEATAFRGIAARINYSALDRPDLQFAAADIAKHIARPTALD